MSGQEHPNEDLPRPNPWKAADVESLLRESGWLDGEGTPEQRAWCERAAQLLGPHAAGREELRELLQLVFHYDAAKLAGQVEAHVVLSRQAARDVLRETGRLLLEGGPFDSDRFKEIVGALKERLGLRSRDLFHPIRLALAGRVGDGELDRVILLLDEASRLQWSVPVKGTRTRIVEFCAAVD